VSRSTTLTLINRADNQVCHLGWGIRKLSRGEGEEEGKGVEYFTVICITRSEYKELESEMTGVKENKLGILL